MRWLGIVAIVLACIAGEARAQQAAPKQELNDCNGAAWCPKMIVIPGGSFMMGSPDSEPDRRKDEGPQLKVTVQSFAAGKFAITREQYAAFVHDSGKPPVGDDCYSISRDDRPEQQRQAPTTWQSPGFDQSDSDPVVCVSWENSKAYVKWLSQKTRQTYRLLTEAEWEYAARAGTQTPYYWGDRDQCAYANGPDQSFKLKFFKSTAPFPSCDDGYAYTAPVGYFFPNAFGLYDMAGNAWQWVEDCYRRSHPDTPTDGSALVSDNCSTHVLRGGGWGYEGLSPRSALRSGDFSTGRRASFGFRVARTL